MIYVTILLQFGQYQYLGVIDFGMWPYIPAIYLCGEHPNVVKGYFTIIIYGIWCHIRPCIGCPC